MTDEPYRLHDPRIVSQRLLTWAAPEQHEGRLINGQYFYFRFRFGIVRLGLGSSLQAALEDQRTDRGRVFGDRLQGSFFDNDDARQRIFSEMLAARLVGRTL